MDGFIDSDGIVVIGATNKIEMLDEALLRAGRFDKRVFVNLPTSKDREEIISYHLKDIPNSIDIKALSQMTAGTNSALISTLINEASLSALNRDASRVEMEDFYSVKDKVFTGRRSKLILKKEDKEILSIYQASKALGLYIFNGKIKNISLFSKKEAQESRAVISKTELISNIRVCLSGVAGLDMVFNNQFSCTKDDIKEAKKIANSMVYDYAMGDKLFGDKDSIDMILNRELKETKKSLTAYKDFIQKIADKLIVQEELDISDIKTVINEIF